MTTKPDAAGAKTSITYGYRDASNYKQWGEFVVSGTLSLQEMLPYLIDEEFFVPAAVGLRCLVPKCRNEDDHELHSFECAEPTLEGQAICSASAFLQRLSAANKKGWFSGLI